MIRKLCAFPNDPIVTYFEKGEIKERYYNPNNFFDEIHLLTLTDKDIEESKVQALAGSGKLKIHSIGKISIRDRTKHLDRILNLVNTIAPNVIRAYNPYLGGWFAASCSVKLRIPFYLSLHTQYDHNRRLVKHSNLKKFLALKYTEKFIEPFILKNADHITIVYKIIEPYVLRLGGKTPELLYNKIDYEKFSNATPLDSLPKPLVISVGNLIKEKNHACIINAMKNLDAHCLIIGNGYLFDDLTNLIKKNKLSDKVIIKKSVPHYEIPNYYKTANVFALSYDPQLEGMPIPVMEAMAAGLPVVIPNPYKNYSDGLEDIAIFSKRDPDSFSQNIKKILEDEDLQKKLSKRSIIKAKDFDSKKIEERESEIYNGLISE